MNKIENKLKFINFIVPLIITLLFTKTSVFAQDSILKYSISLEITKTTIPKALKQIEKQINYYFTYDNKIINKEREVELSVINTPLKKCLNLLLKDKNLTYKVIDNHIVIIKNNNQKYLEVHAIVLDKDTKRPLQFANVSLNKNNIGTITNDEGEFILKIPNRFINEKICVSFIGYKNNCINIKEVLNNTGIFLEKKIISLQEIIIRREDPIKLIKSALIKIETNYVTKPVYFTTFYRESVKKRNDFMFFSEAVLKIYKTPVLTYRTDQIKVLKARKMQNISKLDTFSLELKSGLASSLYLDIVKNKIDFINEDFFEYYDYKLFDIVSFDNNTAYEIEFSPKKSSKRVIYEGNLYISVNDLAIVGAIFKVNDKRISTTNDRFIIKKDRKLKIKVLGAKYRISYKQSDDKYHLNHVLASLKMKIKKKKKIFSINFETSFEMAVMDIDTIYVKRFKRKEISKINTVFIDDFNSYDKSFWEDYNFIKPNEPWQEAIKKINRKMKSSN